MNINEKQQKLILAVLAAICIVLAVVCVWMIACPGDRNADDPYEDEFVYNPGETGLDENGDTIIIVQDTDTEELDSIPNGVENEETTSDSDADTNGENGENSDSQAE